MDYLDVIVHIFTPDAREYYRLEQLWGEAPKRESSNKKGRPVGGLSSGARGARTPDLVAASHALSQLSYGPKFVLDGVVYPVDLVISRRADPEVQDAVTNDFRDGDVVARVCIRASTPRWRRSPPPCTMRYLDPSRRATRSSTARIATVPPTSGAHLHCTRADER